MILSPRFLLVVFIYSHLFFVITIIRQIESFVLTSSPLYIPSSSSSSFINVLNMMEYNDDYGGHGHEYNIYTIKPEETLPLREKVMWQGRPEMCILKDDNNGIHLGLYYCNDSTQQEEKGKGEEEEELLIGVISIFINRKERTAQFRKFAVDQNQQGKGIGSKLLETAITNMKQYTIDDNDNDHDDCDDHQEEQINNDVSSSKNKKLKIFHCDARSNQESFYEKRGFSRVGEPFMKYETKPDQIYVRMEMELQDVQKE